MLEKLSDVDSDLEKHGTKFDSQYHYYTSLALDTHDAHYSSKSLEDLQHLFNRGLKCFNNTLRTAN